MYLILHPILHNFIQLPLLPKYKQNPDLYYNDLVNLCLKLSSLSSGQLAKCEREKWEELSQECLDLDVFQSNIYYDTWSSIAKLAVINKNVSAMEEELKKANKNSIGGSSNSIANNLDKKSKLKKTNKSLSHESLTNMNEYSVEFDRNNYIWGWPFFITFLFYQLIEIKEEKSTEMEDLYIEINDNLEDPHFDYNDNLMFWAKNLSKYLLLMNIIHDKSNRDIKYLIFDDDGKLVDSFQEKVESLNVMTTNCKVIDLIFLRIRESKNTIVYNEMPNDTLDDTNEDDPVDYSKYGKLEQFLPCYNSSSISLAMIQNITKAKGKSFDALKIKEIQKWLMDKLLDSTQKLNNMYDKLDPFKPTPLISIKLLPIVELICSEGGVIRGTFPPAFYMKESAKHNVNRHVILRNQSKKFIYIPPEYIENMHLHLQNLSHCEIYILTKVKTITMTNSHHCKCIFGCISSRLTLNTVQEIKFSACTEQASFEKCQNITAYLYIKKPSLVIGKYIHALFMAPINSWYKDINKHIKEAQIQLSNGQKNNWNSLRLVWFDKDNFDQAVNEQYDSAQSQAPVASTTTEVNKSNSSFSLSPGKGQDQEQAQEGKKEEEDHEINIYHKLDKVLNLKRSDSHLQEKIQKIFLLPPEYYELFVIPIFNKKNRKTKTHLNLKTYSINNLDTLEYDENYQHSSTIMSMETKSSKEGKIKSSSSRNTLNKKKEKRNSEPQLSKENEEDGDGEEEENTKNSVYSKNVLNKLPNEYYKSVMHKHEGHCIVHRILSDKNLLYNDTETFNNNNNKNNNNNDNDNNNNEYDNEDSTERINEGKETEEDINAMVRYDFYKWLKDTNNIEQVQRILNYQKDAA